MIFSRKKYNNDEPILKGDLVSYIPDTDKVTRASIKHWKDYDINKVIGICINTNDNEIIIASTGLVDVNVMGLVCLGDKLTVCDKPGIAKAIKYNQDETKFRYRHIGKVIELYNNYNVVKVMLDIE